MSSRANRENQDQENTELDGAVSRLKGHILAASRTGLEGGRTFLGRRQLERANKTERKKKLPLVFCFF